MVSVDQVKLESQTELKELPSEVLKTLQDHLSPVLHGSTRFTGLVVETTTQCNAKCSMCYQSSGPKGSDTWGRYDLRKASILEAIREAREIEEVMPRLHIAGGEAFLDFKLCLELFESARKLNYHTISATTNAFWATNPKRASFWAEQLASSGLTLMEISWDYWHLPYIKPKAISNCIEACDAAGIETNLRILTSRSHSFKEALSYLSPDALSRATMISSGPVFGSGRAATELPQSELFAIPTNEIKGTCQSILNLTINAKGQVSPCCAGFDQTDSYVLGELGKQTLREVVDRISSDPIMRILIFGGVSLLVSIIEESGLELPKMSTGICDTCWHVFNKPSYVNVIEDAIDSYHRDVLSDFIVGLETNPDPPAAMKDTHVQV